MKMEPRQKQMLDDVFDAYSMLAAGNIVSVMHVQSNVTRWSPGAVELFGLPGEYTENGALDWSEYIHPEDHKRYLDAMTPLSNGDLHSYDLIYRIRSRDGGYISFRVLGSVLRDAAGKPALIGGIMINQGVLENTDPVTILRNQYGFFEDLAAKRREEEDSVILLIGVRRLSRINQLYGYSYGNRVLQQVGWLLQESVRDRGAIYRMEGSTFAVLSAGVPEAEIAAMYDTIRVKLQRGVRVDGIRHNLASSGGMISTHGQRQDERAIYACVRHAYHESRDLRNGDLVNYDGTGRYGSRESLDLINEIRADVLKGCKGFYLRYQPVIRTDTRRMIGVESLIRWKGEPFGEVEPMDFVPVLEQDFVFEELGAWILRRAMTEGLEFLRRDPSLMVGVNIAPSQLEDEYFLDTIVQTADRTGFPLENLALELTRRCRLLDLKRVKPVVEEARKRGIHVILDDFGSGYESIGFLRSLGSDLVKFDRRLIDQIETSRADQLVVRRLAEIAAIYAANVCCKGVNTEKSWHILRDFPIQTVQGNYYSGPVTAAEIIEQFLQ